MNSYTIQSKNLNKEKVFILKKSELEKRLDPQFYKQEYKDNLEKIKRINHKRLGEIVKFSIETWNQKDFFDDTFPYIEISEIDTVSGEIQNIVQVEKEKAASRAKMIVRENDIIISTTRPNRGAISLIRKEQDFSIASTGFSVIRKMTNPEIDREFLFTILRQQIILKQFEQRSSGGNYPAITQEELGSVTIPLPERKIQKKIVKIFNDCFTQKQKNEAAAEKLLASIDDYLLKELGIKLPEPPENTLKNRMFMTRLTTLSGGRFDPFYNSQYFIDFFKEIGKGKFPIKAMKEISKIGSGAIIHTSEYLNEGIPLVRIQNIQQNGIELDDLKYISNETANKNLSSQILEGDLLFGMSGTIGRVAIAQKNLPFCILNQRIAKVQVYGNTDKVYLQAVLNNAIGINQFKKIGTGGIQINIGIPDIENLKIPFPSISKQKEIAKQITGIRQQVQQLKDKTSELLKKASEEIEKILLG